MNRRTFCKGIGIVSGAAASGVVTPKTVFAAKTDNREIDRLLNEGARFFYCGAHPDDEALVGSILAKAGPALGNPVYFLVMTHGDGGACHLPEGCHPTLADLRHKELTEVCANYRATLQNERFFNAPLPVSSFPKRHEIAKIWKEQKDPTMVCAEAIRKFRPDVILTFDPDHGFTGHPEHQLASRFVVQGAMVAADSKTQIGDLKPHNTPNIYYVLNKYWLMAIAGSRDPATVTHTWNPLQMCGHRLNCRDLMAEYTKSHRTQSADMGMVRATRFLIDTVYLHKVDPAKEAKDPFEPVA